MAGAEAATAVAVVVSTGEASAVVLCTAAVVSVGDVSPVAVSSAVAFVVAVLVGATGTITDSLMVSSSAATVIRGRGTGAIRTDIMVTTMTRTITMDTAGTHTAPMDTADTVTMVGPVTDTAMAADQAMSGVRGVGDKPRLRFFSDVTGIELFVDGGTTQFWQINSPNEDKQKWLIQ
jgi:hypothetical protein